MKARLLNSNSSMAARLLLACTLVVSLAACQKEQPAPAPGTPAGDPVAASPNAPTPPASAEPAPAPTPPAQPAATPPASPPPAPPAQPAAPAPAPTPATPEGDDGKGPLPTQVKPGDIVRETHPRTPEHVIQQVLVAALEPDEAKGWEHFKSLLHTDELHPNGLVTRRSMNFAASRRKVDLFLVEKGPLPVFQVSRLLDEGNETLRFFVHNRESMPTPCTARIDRNLDPPAWRVGICSL